MAAERVAGAGYGSVGAVIAVAVASGGRGGGSGRWGVVSGTGRRR